MGQGFPSWGNVNESFVKPSEQLVENSTTPSWDQYEQKSLSDIPLVKPIGEIDTVIQLEYLNKYPLNLNHYFM